MNKVLLSAVSALTVVGVAYAADSTEFGVLTVPSTAEETLVSVPWLASEAESSDVKVCDLVLTAGLQTFDDDGCSKSDELQYWDGSAWRAFVLVKDDVTGTKSWQAKASADPTTPLERGRAILLKRPNASRASQFYIMGKPATGSKAIELGAGYTLIAPPQVGAESVAINDLTWTGLQTGKEYLYVPNDAGMQIFRWIVNKKTGVGAWKATDTGATDGTIVRGKGAWFYSESSGTKSVTF